MARTSSYFEMTRASLVDPTGDRRVRLRCTQLAEMAPVDGNDEQNAGPGQSCASDDRSSPMESQGWNLRRNKPHSRNQNEQKAEFGELDPGGVSNREHAIENKRRRDAPPPKAR
jgi:hypothetical protein